MQQLLRFTEIKCHWLNASQCMQIYANEHRLSFSRTLLLVNSRLFRDVPQKEHFVTHWVFVFEQLRRFSRDSSKIVSTIFHSLSKDSWAILRDDGGSGRGLSPICCGQRHFSSTISNCVVWRKRTERKPEPKAR